MISFRLMFLFYNDSKTESISHNCHTPEAKHCKYKAYYARDDISDISLLKERQIEDVVRVLGIDVELYLLAVRGLEPALRIFVKESLMKDTHMVELEYGSTYDVDPVPVISVSAVVAGSTCLLKISDTSRTLQTVRSCSILFSSILYASLSVLHLNLSPKS